MALLCTDTTLSDEEVIRLYGKRWDIEVFFKVLKSQLRLARELQGRSYDALVAHTPLVFTRYIPLAVETRNERDPRTLGALFLAMCDEMTDIRYALTRSPFCYNLSLRPSTAPFRTTRRK